MNYQNLSGFPGLDLPWRIFPGRLSVIKSFYVNYFFNK